MTNNHDATNSAPHRVIAPKSVCTAFESIAAAMPDAEALAMGACVMTHGELNSRANRLADQLCQQGVGPDVPVGLACGRGFEAVIGMLAILKADGVCVPFDVTLPPERLRTMVALAGLRVVLTTEALQQSHSDLDGPIVIIRFEGRCPGAPNLQSRVRPTNTSHILFTTDASGRPRGVPVPHAAMENLIRWQQQALPFTAGMRVLQFSPPALDSAWQEIAGALCAGSTLIIPTAEEMSTARSLAGLVSSARIERAFLPAATLSHLADAAIEIGLELGALRDLIITCGPAFITSEIRAFFTAHPGCRLHAHYGQTETLVSLAHTVEGTPATWPGMLPLGRPISETFTLVLDSSGLPVKPGAPGDLWIGGSHLPRRYHRDPASNRERFRMHPAGVQGGPARFFLTGDRVRQLPDGRIELARGAGIAAPPSQDASKPAQTTRGGALPGPCKHGPRAAA